jgi:hypothetical protein
MEIDKAVSATAPIERCGIAVLPVSRMNDPEAKKTSKCVSIGVCRGPDAPDGEDSV